MKNKINIAELLKDCPKGMELYSPIFGKVYLDKIRPHLAIVVTTDKEQGDLKEEFLYDGRYGMNGECMLFPSKGKTTWEGFQRPFKDGDILFVKSAYDWICIYKESENDEDLYQYVVIRDNSYHPYIDYGDNPLCCKKDISEIRLATEEEKQKLFDAIKAKGYHWNAETKTLEKLIEPKFKVGDIIHDVDYYKVQITEINEEEELYIYYSVIAKGIGAIPFEEQDNWKLVPNKFDINTLKPFDKVLMRSSNAREWTATFYSHYSNDYFFGCGMMCQQCIPYKGNEYLLGTTEDCDVYYKNW